MTRILRTALRIGSCLPLAAGAQQASATAAPQVAVDCKALAGGKVDHATMDHSAHDAILDACAGPLPKMSGQAAFAAIAEVVALLRASPTTDWSRVNLEGLRLHLIDMDEVLTRSSTAQKSIPGGIEIEVTGVGRTVAAIKRMAISHTRSLDQGPDYRASAKELGNGARLTITAKDPSNARLVAILRGLGFAGLMTEGDHHVRHHLALARGDVVPHK